MKQLIFNNNIENTDSFRTSKYKVKLLGNTVVRPAPNNANGILKNAISKLKHKWTKNCVLSSAGNGATNDNLNNIIFTMKDTKLYVLVVTLSARDS